MTEGNACGRMTIGWCIPRSGCLQIAKKKSPLPGGLLSFFGDICHNVVNIAVKQPAKLIDGVGGDIVAMLHGIVVGLREPHFEQSVGSDSLFLHGAKQWFIADHNTTSMLQLYFVYAVLHIYEKRHIIGGEKDTNEGVWYANAGRDIYAGISW